MPSLRSSQPATCAPASRPTPRRGRSDSESAGTGDDELSRHVAKRRRAQPLQRERPVEKPRLRSQEQAGSASPRRAPPPRSRSRRAAVRAARPAGGAVGYDEAQLARIDSGSALRRATSGFAPLSKVISSSPPGRSTRRSSASARTTSSSESTRSSVRVRHDGAKEAPGRSSRRHRIRVRRGPDSASRSPRPLLRDVHPDHRHPALAGPDEPRARPPRRRDRPGRGRRRRPVATRQERAFTASL